MDVEIEIWGSEATSPRLGRERGGAGPEDHSGEDMRSGRKTYLGGCRHHLLAGPDKSRMRVTDPVPKDPHKASIQWAAEMNVPGTEQVTSMASFPGLDDPFSPPDGKPPPNHVRPQLCSGSFTGHTTKEGLVWVPLSLVCPCLSVSLISASVPLSLTQAQAPTHVPLYNKFLAFCTSKDHKRSSWIKREQSVGKREWAHKSQVLCRSNDKSKHKLFK